MDIFLYKKHADYRHRMYICVEENRASTAYAGLKLIGLDANAHPGRFRFKVFIIPHLLHFVEKCFP